jgi:hypothetical protein
LQRAQTLEIFFLKWIFTFDKQSFIDYKSCVLDVSLVERISMKSKLKLQSTDQIEFNKGVKGLPSFRRLFLLIMNLLIAGGVLLISLYAPGQLVQGGVVTWMTVGILLTGVVPLFR